MKSRSGRTLLRESILPLTVFVAAVAAHVVWLGVFPEKPAGLSVWAALPDPGPSSWLPRYLGARDYWLGYSYGLCLAFAAVAFRRYRRSPCRAAGGLAVGGLTLSGVLAIAGCYLVGCCGSPMLVVWLNLFGARFLPFAKPLVAAATTLSIAAASWWITRERGRASCDPAAR